MFLIGIKMLYKGLWFNSYSTSRRMVPHLCRILLLSCITAMLSAGCYSVLSGWQLLYGSVYDITSGSHGHWPIFTFSLLTSFVIFLCGISSWWVKDSVNSPNNNTRRDLKCRKSKLVLRILAYFCENKLLVLPWWNAVQSGQQMTCQVLWNGAILWSQGWSLLQAAWTFSNNSS